MKERLKRDILIILGLLFLIAVVALYVYIYAIPSITGSLKETVILNYGNLQTSSKLSCLIVRSEKVQTANEGGRVSYYAEESSKNRRGVKVLDIYTTSGNHPYYCPATGFVSYYFDGLESLLGPDTLANIDPKDFIGESPKYPARPESIVAEEVRAGEVLYKLVDSNLWYIAAFVPKDLQRRYKTGMDVKVEFADGTRIPGSITEMIKRGDYVVTLISTKRYYSEFAKLRLEELTLISEDSEGLIVPETALAAEDGLEGVYVKDINGNYKFTRVKVLVRSEGNLLLHMGDFSEYNKNGEPVTVSSVSIYDEVLRDASKLDE